MKKIPVVVALSEFSTGQLMGIHYRHCHFYSTRHVVFFCRKHLWQKLVLALLLCQIESNYKPFGPMDNFEIVYIHMYLYWYCHYRWELHFDRVMTVMSFHHCTKVRNGTFQSRKFYQLELLRKPILKLWDTSLYF